MKEIAILLTSLILVTSCVGCGFSDPPPAADGSNLPSEVKTEEDKFDANNAKRAADYEKKHGKSASH